MSEVRINNVALSPHRLARIEGARSLDEAQRMGLFDRVVDWLRGGVKSEAIRQVFDLLRAPDGARGAAPAQHDDLLLHFQVLQGALRAEYMDKCQLSVQRDDDRQTWSYCMQLDEQTLVRATDLPMLSGQTLAAFEDHAMLARLGHCLQKGFGVDSSDQCQLLREKFAAINAGHADLTGPAVPAAGLEKFRLICANLGPLGVPARGCYPGVQVSADLSSVELSLGDQWLGVYPLANQQALTDTLTTMAQAGIDAVDHMLQARDPRQSILSAVQDMVDDIHQRRIMEAQMDDPFFCAANFVGAAVLADDSSKFEARFQQRSPAGAARTLVFSNRHASNFELRGQALQDKLAAGGYATLADLIGQRLGGPEDSDIPYLATGARFGLVRVLSFLDADEDARERLGFADMATVGEFFQGLKENVFAPMKVGNTDLAQVWRLGATEYGSLDQAPAAQPATVPAQAPAGLPRAEMGLLVAHKA